MMRAMRFLTVLLLFSLLAGSHALAADFVWRLAERVDIEAVPSWFPVGFSLLTRGQRQYVAYYDAQHQMTVAVRTLPSREWQRVALDSKVGWDSHNSVTMAVDDNGDLHVAGNMHCVPLVYFRTETPGDITTLKRLPMTGKDEDRCTYPRFLVGAEDRFLFHYRDGRSGNGREIYNVYDPGAHAWTRLLQSPLFDGEGKRNAYATGPLFGPDKRFHVLWVWRDTPDCATNNNLSYARSSDLIRWETAKGEPVELPMMLETPGLIVDPIPSGGGIINGGAKLAFDSHERPMAVYHKSDEQGNMQIYAARFADGRWQRSALTAWDKQVKFAGFGTMPFIGISVSAPSHAAGDVWTVAYRHRDYGSGTIAFSETTLQPAQARLPQQSQELPSELNRSEISFEGVRTQRADDLGQSDDPNVRYVLTWETLPPNHDRNRTGLLPPASMLRVNKLVRNLPLRGEPASRPATP